MLILKLFWRGELALPVSFWGGFVLIDFLVLDRLGIQVINLGGNCFTLRFATALIVVFNGFVLPGVWRSASYWTGRRLWSVAAKALCVFAAIRIVLTFVDLMVPDFISSPNARHACVGELRSE